MYGCWDTFFGEKNLNVEKHVWRIMIEKQTEHTTVFSSKFVRKPSDYNCVITSYFSLFILFLLLEISSRPSLYAEGILGYILRVV